MGEELKIEIRKASHGFASLPLRHTETARSRNITPLLIIHWFSDLACQKGSPFLCKSRLHILHTTNSSEGSSCWACENPFWYFLGNFSCLHVSKLLPSFLGWWEIHGYRVGQQGLRVHEEYSFAEAALKAIQRVSSSANSNYIWKDWKGCRWEGSVHVRK